MLLWPGVPFTERSGDDKTDQGDESFAAAAHDGAPRFIAELIEDVHRSVRRSMGLNFLSDDPVLAEWKGHARKLASGSVFATYVVKAAVSVHPANGSSSSRGSWTRKGREILASSMLLGKSMSICRGLGGGQSEGMAGICQCGSAERHNGGALLRSKPATIRSQPQTWRRCPIKPFFSVLHAARAPDPIPAG